MMAKTNNLITEDGVDYCETTFTESERLTKKQLEQQRDKAQKTIDEINERLKVFV